jgi:hypothetical protein
VHGLRNLKKKRPRANNGHRAIDGDDDDDDEKKK